MEKQRTTDLFRFVTLRSPESVTSERKKLGFIEQADYQSSHFLQYADSPNAPELIQNAMASFIPATSPETITSQMSQLRDYSIWLEQNKHTLTKEILKNISEPSELPNDGLRLILWDNLYYSVLTQDSHSLRQLCLQLLVAINFIENHKFYFIENPAQIEKETANLRRLANGKVLIHKALTPAKDKSTPAAAPRRKNSKLETQLEAKIAGQNVPVLKSILKEFTCLEKQYNNDYRKALTEAKSGYEQQVETLVQNYLNEHPELELRGETEYLLPENIAPDFKFDYPLPLSPAYTEGKLSTDAVTYIQDRCLRNESIKTVQEHLRNDLNSTAKTASRSSKKQYNTVLINGVLTRPASSEPKEFSLSFRNQTPGSKSTDSKYSVMLLLNAGYNGAFFNTAIFKLSLPDGTNQEEKAIIHSSTDNSIFAELFSDKPIQMIPNQKFTFEAEFTLDNGKSFKINKTGTTSAPTLNGTAVLAFADGETVEHYGINRIGIADYRRVEQELCCYIPGEVSHIENILAKEYKERSTRNLTSTETTIESTTEREMEDLTDTTSSTRHEMSSEIAEVIEKDRQSNFGFSTGVNGSYGNAFSYSADASGDFTFGQSTSDSDTLAKTYAEDVTRRALERIVQKTSLKRTSKVLREFEENNKHGYDNREGDQHVTGIFRWIDKVYKNRIVNYSKRLMYEFMVPEPARFYKEAIIIQAEEEDTTVGTGTGSTGSTTVAVKPTHPSEYGVKDAASITRGNYATMASHYGISLDAPLDEFSNATDVYAQSIGNTDAAKSFSFNNLRVPDNYQCFELKGTASYNYKAKVGAKAYIKVNAAGKNWEHTELRGESNLTESFTHSLNNIEGFISVSINTKKIVTFNVSVEAKCRLKASIFEQWQQDTYADIMRAYEDQLRAFNEAQAINDASNAADAAAAAAEDKTIDRNPLFNAEIVKIELKRLCIEMLTKPFGIPQGKDFYQDGACEVPELKLTKELDIYSSRVKFFEQAFDWDLMSQKFYPYYWAKRCDWKALFQAQDGNDYIFQSFLQSGMGRVVVPVRLGFEDAVTYFMETGEVWNGNGMAVKTDDDLYLSIVDEMTQVGGYVEGAEWETVVPSSLTIVQARSALLDDEGLPCCHTDADVLNQLKIKADTNILQLKSDTTTV